MTQFSASKFKMELREGFAALCCQLHEESDAPNVSGIFWILDGGNGHFYLYASRSTDAPTYQWDEVLEEPVLVHGKFCEIVAMMDALGSQDDRADLTDEELERMLEHGFEEDEEEDLDRRVLMEDGSLEDMNGDASTNALLSRLIVEVMHEPSSLVLLDGLRHPHGCFAYVADDEVNAHGQVVTLNLSSQQT